MVGLVFPRVTMPSLVGDLLESGTDMKLVCLLSLVNVGLFLLQFGLGF